MINNDCKELYEMVLASNLDEVAQFGIVKVLFESSMCDIKKANSPKNKSMPKVRGSVEKITSRAWTNSDREALFKRVFNAFGPSSNWTTVVPEKGHKDVLISLGKDFKRTPGAIKAQIRDAVSVHVSDKNIRSIRKARKIALKVGLINESQLKIASK